MKAETFIQDIKVRTWPGPQAQMSEHDGSRKGEQKMFCQEYARTPKYAKTSSIFSHY